jgi:hypothetical protein
MKKLRMILTSAIVLAIAGSAFSFKAKLHSFCVLDAAASGTNCTTVIKEKNISAIGIQFKYYPSWDGDPIACTAANNGLCTATVRLNNND